MLFVCVSEEGASSSVWCGCVSVLILGGVCVAWQREALAIASAPDTEDKEEQVRALDMKCHIERRLTRRGR